MQINKLINGSRAPTDIQSPIDPCRDCARHADPSQNNSNTAPRAVPTPWGHEGNLFSGRGKRRQIQEATSKKHKTA